MASEKNQLLTKVDRLLGPPAEQGSYEIEARIGHFDGSRFVSSVDPKKFFRVLNHFLQHPDIYTPVGAQPDQTMEASFEQYVPGDRFPRRIRETWNLSTPDIRLYGSKRNLGTVDMPNYFVRFSKALEKIETPDIRAKLPALPQSVRQKDRWSFVVSDPSDEHPLKNYRVDLTHVQGSYIKEGAQLPMNSYEIELEINEYPIKNTERELWPGIQYMLSLVQDTPFPFTSATATDVVESFNALLDGDIIALEHGMSRRNPRWTFPRQKKLFNILNKPVNLKLSDLDNQKLSITDKADGERRLLFVREDGAYLLFPPFEVSRYLKIKPTGENKIYKISNKAAKKLDGTVFDGELVLNKDGHREYLAFDLLFETKKDLRQEPFQERINKMSSIINDYFSDALISAKKYLFPEDGGFYDRVGQILDEIPAKNYENDGLIFNGVDDIYTLDTKILKWKPPDQLTIDFYVHRIGPEQFEIMVKDRDRMVKFTGSQRYPYSGVITVSPPQVDRILMTTGQIVEMGWDVDRETFIPYRIRHDRDMPNNLGTAIDVWRDIMNPITEATIRGDNLVLMRNYHNLIKRNLLENCLNTGYILDIGGGRGGDIHKWKAGKFNVLTIEPNSEHVQELIKRAKEAGYKITPKGGVLALTHGDGSVVAPVIGLGQETEKIAKAYDKVFGSLRGKQSANCVTLFNVLTFFYDKEATLDGLVETIDKMLQPGGILVGMVMDGKAVKDLLSSSKTVKDSGWTISKIGKFTDKPFGNKIKIHLEDTIVTDQTEYLVDFDVFIKKLAKKGISLQKETFLTNDNLSYSQQRLNNLYRTFTFKRSEPTREPEEIKINPLIGKYEKELTDLERQRSLTLESKKALLDIIEREKDAAKKITTKVESLRKARKKISAEEGKKLQEEYAEHRKKILTAERGLELNKESLGDVESRLEEITTKLEKLSLEQTASIEARRGPKPWFGRRPPPGPVPPQRQTGVKKPPPEKPRAPEESPKNEPPPKRPGVAKRRPPRIPESALIKETIEPAKGDIFVPEETELAMLEPEETTDLDIGPAKFVRIGTILNECAISVLLRALIDVHIMGKNRAKAKDLTSNEIKERIRQIGKSKQTIMSGPLKAAFKKGTLPILVENYETWGDVKEALGECKNWGWLGLWGKLAEIFKANIIVITASDPFSEPEIIKTGSGFPKTVIIYNHDGVFDLVGQRDGDGNLVTVFDKDDITLHSL